MCFHSFILPNIILFRHWNHWCHSRLAFYFFTISVVDSGLNILLIANMLFLIWYFLAFMNGKCILMLNKYPNWMNSKNITINLLMHFGWYFSSFHFPFALLHLSHTICTVFQAFFFHTKCLLSISSWTVIEFLFFLYSVILHEC